VRVGQDPGAVGFAGARRESNSGLVYLRNRWYDPNVGRFLSRDPIGFEGGWNVYGYAGNNPVSRRDPRGLTDAGITWDASTGEWVIDKTVGSGGSVGQSSNATPEDPSWEMGATAAVVTITGATSFLWGPPVGATMGALGAASTAFQQGLAAYAFAYAPRVYATLMVLQGVSRSTASRGTRCNLTNRERRSIRSHQRLIEEHWQKIENYLSNPYAQDNKNVLRNAASDEIQQKIILGRVKSLLDEIGTHIRNVNDILGIGDGR